MAGDILARGGKSATFGPATGVSQTTWDSIWAEDEFDKNGPPNVKEDFKKAIKINGKQS